MDFILVDKSRFKDAVKAYWLWKELNSIIKNSHNRGINFPETISETILCYALGFELNRGSGGDARNPANNEIIEVKGTSNFDRDVSSFSPKEEFDKLYFVRLNQKEDIAYIYDLSTGSSDLKQMKVNKDETFEDQQNQGRRPRFSIIKSIIDEKGLEPIAKIDFRKEKTEKITS